MNEYTVLLVEDDKNGAYAIASVIELHTGVVRYKVDIVSSIAECTARLNEQSYHVILLDLNLANGKGADTFRRIYAVANRDVGTPNESRTPIVILTGDDVTDYSEMVMQGAQDYIRKPFDTKVLCERLHMAIIRWPWKKTQELRSESRSLLQEARTLVESLDTKHCVPSTIGVDKKLDGISATVESIHDDTKDIKDKMDKEIDDAFKAGVKSETDKH